MDKVFALVDRLIIGMAGMLLVFVAYIVLNRGDYLSSPAQIAALVFAPLVVAASLAGSFALRREARANLVLTIAFSLGALYAIEAFLTVDPFNLVGTGAEADRAATWEHARDLQRAGEDAYPVVGAARWMEEELIIEGDAIAPLSGIPHVTAVMCDEGGGMATYRSDRFGFNNDDALWDGSIEVALVGDSFVEGWCVPSADSFAGLIAAARSRTINLGYSSLGPLAELGALREHLSERRPRQVVWFFFEGNDLTEDLPRELESDILRRYLDDGYTQRLETRSSMIGAEMRRRQDEWIERAEARAATRAGRSAALARAASIAKLQATRKALGLNRTGGAEAAGLDSLPWEEFRQTLAHAKRIVQGWGGTVHFVYLPDYPSASGAEWPHRLEVLRIAEALELPTIDLTEDFRASADPGSLFFVDGGGIVGPIRPHHYNQRGHALVAARVLEQVP